MTRKASSRRDDSGSDRGSDSDHARKRDFRKHVPNRRRSSPVRNSSSDREHSKRRRIQSPDRVKDAKSQQSEKQTRRSDEKETETAPEKPKRKPEAELLTMRTGGAYIPPARLKLMQEAVADKNSIEYQRISWEALKKSLHGLINKINISNIGVIVREIFKENIVRGRGLLCRDIMQAQSFSPGFSHVYAALVSVTNSKFPQTGELLLRRLVIQFRRGFRRNDKQLCLTSARFIAHLVNQQVAHEVLALEILTLLLESPTEDSVEVAVGFLKECGSKLKSVSPKGVDAIFDRLRNILHEHQLEKRVQYMIEVMFAVRKDDFQDFQAVVSELDLVEEADQFTHLIALDETTNSEDILNVFKHDPEFEANEEKYKTIRKVILDEGSSGSEGSGSESEDGDEEEDTEEEVENQEIIDNTETNLVSLRRTIYLTIQSSLDFEECAHKLLKLELKPGQIIELCHMILDCCAQQRTYEKFYGLLAQRFCQLNKVYVEPFQEIFKTAYDTIHRFETNKLRNVAKFFAHLLYTDAITWLVLSTICLNEEDTTSSSRIFIKILFQELCEYMSLPKLNDRVKDPTLQEAFDGLFPRDNPRNTRFAINFFTSIGLGGLTDDLREHLKTVPKSAAPPPPPPVLVPPTIANEKEDSSSDDDEEDSSSDDESDDSEEEKPKKKKRNKSKKSKAKKRSKHKKKDKKGKPKHPKDTPRVTSNQEHIQRLRSEIQFLEKEQEKLAREKERRRLLQESNRLQQLEVAREAEQEKTTRLSPPRIRDEIKERKDTTERTHKPREEDRERVTRQEAPEDTHRKRDDVNRDRTQDRHHRVRVDDERDRCRKDQKGDDDREKGRKDPRDDDRERGRKDVKDDDRDRGRKDLKDDERERGRKELKDDDRERARKDVKDDDRGRKDLKEDNRERGRKDVKDDDRDRGRKDVKDDDRDRIRKDLKDDDRDRGRRDAKGDEERERARKWDDERDRGRREVKDWTERTRDLPRSIRERSRERSRERQRERVEESPRKKHVQNSKEERRPNKSHDREDSKKVEKGREKDYSERRRSRDSRVLAEVKI